MKEIFFLSKLIIFLNYLTFFFPFLEKKLNYFRIRGICVCVEGARRWKNT